jgi:hypothetical protein
MYIAFVADVIFTDGTFVKDEQSLNMAWKFVTLEVVVKSATRVNDVHWLNTPAINLASDRSPVAITSNKSVFFSNT